MGKRRLHDNTYFQCDWTGLPMRTTNCYMPSWNENGKLTKHGSYCCWEAVVAHAQEKREDATKVCEYINNLVGCTVEAAPHWSQLSWFRDSAGGEQGPPIDTPTQFLEACINKADPIIAVRMPPGGVTHEVMCSADDARNSFKAHLTTPFNLHGPLHEPQSFLTVRKKGVKDRDITVFYWPFKNGLLHNQIASQMFKMQIYGDVVIVQQTKEHCFLPRERYVNFFNVNFQEQFKRRRDTTPTLSTEEYGEVKAELVSELQQLEEVSSSSASMPGDLAKASVILPPSGKEIAKLLRAQGHEPPSKRSKAILSPESSVALAVGA